MGQVLVRNLDDDVIDRLKTKAARENVSLGKKLRDILTDAARPSREELLAELDRIRAMSRPVEGDSTALIREDRDNVEPYR